MHSSKDIIIGIDLGTTNSAVAVMDGAEPTIIPNQEGSRLTPSVVAFTTEGEVLVGETARRQAAMNPQRTIHSIKRFMGRRYREVKREEKIVSYDVVGGRRGYAKVSMDGREYTPPEISAHILRKLKQSAEAHLGRPVSSAVITVPAYFNDAQRQATKDAGEIAGLEVERIVNEPTAAALAYGLDQQQGKRIAVFDLGGGTFDVSLLEISDGVFKVLSTNGDTRLGGDDFDQAMLTLVADRFKGENGIDLRDDPLALARLREACEKAKCELSNVDRTDVTLPFISADQHGPKHLQTTVTRVEFEQLITPFIERCCKPVLKAMQDANLSAAEIDEVVLVGGSTRIPRVVEMAQEMFGREPHRGVHPGEIVAAGAAVQGAMLSDRSREMVLLDVVPLSLGIETTGGFMTNLVDRNTTIPTQRSEVFSTSEDNQSIVIVRVYQGERDLAEHNRLLDEFCLEGIRPAPRGEPQIEVTFDVDANGILHVSAKDGETGKQQKVRITDSGGLSSEEVERLKADAERHKDDDRRSRMKAELKDYAESMCRETQRQLDTAPQGVDPELLTAVSNLISHTREIASGENLAVIKAGINELGRASHDLGSAITAAKAQPQAPPSTADGNQPSSEIIDVEFEVKDRE